MLKFVRFREIIFLSNLNFNVYLIIGYLNLCSEFPYKTLPYSEIVIIYKNLIPNL